MAEEQGNFRRKVLGGFDQIDVINYIEELSTQRNKFQSDAQQLTWEMNGLKSKVEELNQRLTEKDGQIAKAAEEISSVRQEKDEVWKELRATLDELEVLRGRLDKANKELNAKTAEYQNTLAAKTEEYQKTLAEVNQRHMDELAARQEQYAADMAAKTEQYQEKLTAAAQELEAVKRTAEARRLAVIDSAQQIVSDLSSRFDSAALRLRNELDSVAGNMASVSDSFTSAADKLNALRQNGAE